MEQADVLAGDQQAGGLLVPPVFELWLVANTPPHVCKVNGQGQ